MPSTPGGLPYPPATDPLKDGAAAIQALAVAVDGKLAGYALVRDEKPSGTAGGAAAAATWNVRTLNVESSDLAGLVALAANRITLPAGTYRVRAHAPAYNVNGHKLRLRNVTDNVTLAVGSSEFAGAGEGVVSRAFLEGVFTIVAGKQLELQHYTAAASAGNGLGVVSATGELEVYATLEIWRM